ncbi:very-long-chain 3-oxoacyl-CoA reductase-B [Nematostella vectensis]|uniref:very-long-chain 3-oxoacyl-CoA reductase-B n=1 Tax=Nematostella vectensis TaxID=45351 RepID=UPI002076F158|nr:very-long-chain 3-oxoacyl-CoA reductase-B [Nematostella vectensis]XP_048581422.1 very-long-chain 3-oxoacyl-CoA reductase-B [Nematostella vectensis]
MADGSAATVLAVFGGVFLLHRSLYFLIQILNGITTFLLPYLGLSTDLKRYGSWAVVTGCTDGIGRCYAEKLAGRGLNIVLISRSLEKLKQVQQHIESQFYVQTKIIVKDFGGNAELYQDLDEQLSNLDIGILVNNVGMASMINRFADLKIEDCWKMLNVNALSAVMMTHIVLPGMLSRQRGVVVNVSSLVGSDPMPLMSVYYATKAFLDFFSSCLHSEYSSKGIFVQCVRPAFVATKMTGMRNKPGTALTPTADQYVEQALGTIGVEQRTSGFWSHSLMAWVTFNIIPAWVRNRIWWKLWSTARKMYIRMAKSGHQQ